MQTVVYNSPLYYLVLLSVVYSMYIFIKLLSYYYYFIIISLFSYFSANKPNIIIILISTSYTILFVIIKLIDIYIYIINN